MILDSNTHVKAGKRTDDIPSKPDKVHKDKGWASWLDFLWIVRWKKLEEAREYMRTLNLKTDKDWREWCKFIYNLEYLYAFV